LIPLPGLVIYLIVFQLDIIEQTPIIIDDCCL